MVFGCWTINSAEIERPRINKKTVIQTLSASVDCVVCVVVASDSATRIAAPWLPTPRSSWRKAPTLLVRWWHSFTWQTKQQGGERGRAALTAACSRGRHPARRTRPPPRSRYYCTSIRVATQSTHCRLTSEAARLHSARIIPDWAKFCGPRWTAGRRRADPEAGTPPPPTSTRTYWWCMEPAALSYIILFRCVTPFHSRRNLILRV